MSYASRMLMVAALSSAAMVGCSRDSEKAQSSLSFSYTGFADDGYIDQVVSISNTGLLAMVPLVEYTALDADGDVLPDVTVTTAFGSDRELLVVAPGGGYDILQFEGPGADKVEDVRSDVKRALSSPLVGAEAIITVTPFDAAGDEITKFDPFTEVLLDNPYTTAVHVRVVCVVYGPPDDRPEEASEITELFPRVDLAGGASIRLPIDEADSRLFEERSLACHSLKAHLTP